jgi:hypothetical protein
MSARLVIFWLTSGMFLMFLARLAYSSVDSVSSNASEAGDTVAMIAVLARPPSDSCSRRVSFDSRYGTCGWLSVSAVMTRPSVSRL